MDADSEKTFDSNETLQCKTTLNVEKTFDSDKALHSDEILDGEKALNGNETRSGDKILEVRELTKSFYGVAANDRVSFDLRSGEVHGLLGENGAGKSTLCSVLAGLYRPDSGQMMMDGETIHIRSPHDGAARGIGMVYQHFRLVSSFTVAENMVLGLRQQRRRLSLRSVEARVAELGDEYGLDVDPSVYIWQLSVGEQQRVEILRQLFRGARIMILDEPTAVLAPHECDRLFEAVRHIASQNHSVVLVSHKMDEILANTDRVTVLRRGRNAGTVITADTSAAELARMMIGAEQSSRAAIAMRLTDTATTNIPRESAGASHPAEAVDGKPRKVVTDSSDLAQVNDAKPRQDVTGTSFPAETDRSKVRQVVTGTSFPVEAVDESGPVVLEVSDVRVVGDRGTRTVNGASLKVRAGQVVGVAGVAGNGQRELQEAIAGLRPVESGTIRIAGKDVTGSDPRAISRAGLAYVPEDRLGTGLASGLTMQENLVLKSYNQPPHCRWGVVSARSVSGTAGKLVEMFDVRGAREGMPVSLMSGGNLQKAILARELTQPHLVLLAASPTRGLDLAATAAVRRHILEETYKGGAVLLFSEDLEEITELSEMILVMSAGRIVGAYTPATLDIEELGLLMTGAKAHNR